MSARGTSRLLAAVPLLLAGCRSAAPAPPELEAARLALFRAQRAAAAGEAAAELEAARAALARAEEIFADDRRAPETRDLAYLALRRTELAEALREAASLRGELAALTRQRAQLLARRRAEKLEREHARAAEEARVAAAVRAAREAAEARVTRALEELRRLGELSETERGVVLRLPERELFSTATTKLKPEAEPLLVRLACVLAELDRAHFTVLAHDDLGGAAERARRRTLEEADRVRTVLVAAGLAPQRVEAAGKGRGEPLTASRARRGRALNRRLEVWIEPRESPESEDIYAGLLAR